MKNFNKSKPYVHLSHSIIKTLTISSIILVAAALPAYAYSDPGTGLLAWQLIASSVVGLLFYFRKILASFLGKIKPWKNDK